MAANSKCLIPASAFRLHFADSRSASHAGWTFGSFITACRAMGMRDHDSLAAIDFGNASFGTRCLSVEMDDDLCGFVIREER